jgi:hypothetical protein
MKTLNKSLHFTTARVLLLHLLGCGLTVNQDSDMRVNDLHSALT